MSRQKQERLQAGETFVTREKGNSMRSGVPVPLIASGQSHRLAPCTWEQAQIGDIVFCKVRGTYEKKGREPTAAARNGGQ